MKRCLKDIAKIDSGKSFRHRIDDDPYGNCMVIQMKDVSYENQAIDGSPQSISLDDVNPEQLLDKGDILFMAKGNNNFAIKYNLDQPAVAVSLFFVIKPNRNIVNPQYLTWYLNSPTAQAYLSENREGATVGNIRIDVLRNIEIEIPNLDRQDQIAKLSQLLIEEKTLTNEYLEKKQLLLKQTMTNLISKPMKYEYHDVTPWNNIISNCNTMISVLHLKKPIMVDNQMMSEIVCSLHSAKTEFRKFIKQNGSSETVNQIKSWPFVLWNQLQEFNSLDDTSDIKSRFVHEVKHENILSITLKNPVNQQPI